MRGVVVLRCAWLWVSGGMAFNAAWAYVWGQHAAAVFYLLFSLLLIGAFVYTHHKDDLP